MRTKRFSVIVASLAASAVLSPLLSAFAATSTNAVIPKSVRQAIESIRARVEERIQKREENREQVHVRLQEQRKELIRGFFSRMVNRFEAALERELRLMERIQTRIALHKGRGLSIAVAEEALARARIRWEEATAALNEAKTKLEGVLGTEDPKEAFGEVRALVETSREKIKTAHRAMVEAVIALGGKGPTAASATPAPADE